MRRTVALALAVAALTALAAATAASPGPDAERQRIWSELEALAAPENGASAGERFATLVDLYFDYAMNEFPEFATMIGHPTGHDRWSDDSLAGIARREADERKLVEILGSIERDELAAEARLNYDLLLEDLRHSIDGQRFDGEYLAINQMGGVQQNVSRMIAMMPATTVGQYEDILARLEAGLARGVTPPRVTLRDVPQQIENQLADDPMESPMLRAFGEFPESIPAAESERLAAAAARVFRQEVAPALRRLHAYLVETYIPQSRDSIAMKDLPDGEAWYAHRVRQMTTTDLAPREIHEIGLAEVERIRAEMDGVIESAGFEGTFAEFLEFLRTDPRFYYEKPEDLLSGYRDIAKRADAELPRLFGTLPRLPYGVVPVPDYAEKSQTTAYYERGSLAAGRAGLFFANTYKLDTRPKWEMEALSLHEAVPGHHLQIALAQELEELPWFRRFGHYTAFIEGWGLYAESLGEDMGFYTDPYARFGQLTYEMWRAIRLVVDTGMHQLGWSRERAIDFFKENAGKQEHDIVVEVDRYIVWPGQALAYKIGELKLQELKAMARDELGERFDIRAFHDTVLGNGPLPLKVLEANVRDWVAAEKTPEVARPAARGR